MLPTRIFDRIEPNPFACTFLGSFGEVTFVSTIFGQTNDRGPYFMEKSIVEGQKTHDLKELSKMDTGIRFLSPS